MSDLNPYEPPKILHSRVPTKVKRGIGLALALVLTPPAVISACVIGCSSMRYFQSAWIMILLPLGVLVVMTGTAFAALYRRHQGAPRMARSKRILIALPFAVVGAVPLGFGLALLSANVLYGTEEGWYAISALFFAPSAITMVAMCYAAWTAQLRDPPPRKNPGQN